MKPVTVAKMQEIDKRSETDFGISGVTLMETAGAKVAQETLKFIETKLNKKPSEALVAICCGRGNNGGDGIACGRTLKKMGVNIDIHFVPPGDKPLKIELQTQLDKVKEENTAINPIEDTEKLAQALDKADVIVDALLGTGAKSKPMGLSHKVIQKMMKAEKPIIALDVPSGMNSDTGHHTGVYIQAVLTVTLGLPKVGLQKPHAQQYVGELVTVDIGHPKELLEPFL
ncbi:NAD(P)H-hydrate epimerase [Elusimicrobiota bacterium]